MITYEEKQANNLNASIKFHNSLPYNLRKELEKARTLTGYNKKIALDEVYDKLRQYLTKAPK